MCGIAGFLDLQKSTGRDVLERMTRIMEHRGPDGEGYFVEGIAGLGHRRLSIIDLSGGHQPMANEDETVWVSFNGEIYNFPELRDELIKLGHRFQTRSDTEVIVHAWEEWGSECPKRMCGMFAFAVWDMNTQRLFLARDRLGKKPLYYVSRPELFLFGSEIKALLEHSAVSRDLNPGALADYLNYNYIPFPKTIFQNVEKLPPGHSLLVQMSNSGGLQTHLEKYWDIHYAPDSSLTEDQWCEALREKLREAVKMRLISDVPLGAFLSGGIDSSAVVGLMSEVQDQPVKTFSIGFKEEDFSELKYARQVAEKFGTEHHEYVVEPDAMEVLPKLSWQFDEPFADSSAVPTYYVSKLARENVTVILSGDGGDETFAGYRRYLWAKEMGRLDWVPDSLKKATFGLASKVMPEGMRGKGTLRHLSRSPFERYAGFNTFGEKSYFDALFTRSFKEHLGYGDAYRAPDYSIFAEAYANCNSEDYLSRIQYLDSKVYLAEDILTKVDRTSMLCSLETRAPLLDHEVIELAARMPSELKLKNGETKYILKKALEPILPRDILYRRKMGFGVPLVHWFKTDLEDYARDVLLSKKSLERGFFEKKAIEDILDVHSKQGRDLSARIWALLFFENWCLNWL